MNRIVFVARKAKGLTTKDVADVLTMPDNEYLELENSIRKITLEEACRLGDFYHIPHEMILAADPSRTKKYQQMIETYKETLYRPDIRNFYSEADIKFAQMAVEALRANDELYTLLTDHITLKQDHDALKELYHHLKQTLRQLKGDNYPKEANKADQ